jgi:DNA-binding GntR family transcriptional regulator
VHRFGVARMTVRQAMDALVAEGLLERIPGRGTFVARPRGYGKITYGIRKTLIPLKINIQF